EGDGESHGGGEGGEYPADDGTDPSPRPFSRGPADGAFSQWLSASNPDLGGSPAFAFQPKNPGDPADLVNAAMGQDDEAPSQSSHPSLARARSPEPSTSARCCPQAEIQRTIPGFWWRPSLSLRACPTLGR